MNRPSRRLRRILAALGALAAALLCLLTFGTGPVAAHAALTATEPGPDTVLEEAPKSVTLRFSEAVQLGDDSIRVLDPDGNEVGKGAAHHVDGDTKTSATALQPGLPDGTFTVVWKAVSADSHPISGAFTFSIGEPSKTSVAVSGTDGSNGAKVWYDTGRYLAYAGFVLLVGGSVFAVVCGGRGQAVRRVAGGGWALLFASTAALLLLRGPYTEAGFGLEPLREVLATRPGSALLSRLLLLGVAAVVLAVLFGVYERAMGAGVPAAAGKGANDGTAGDGDGDGDKSSDGAGAGGAAEGGDGADGTAGDRDAAGDAGRAPAARTQPTAAEADAAMVDDLARSRDLAVGVGLGGGVVAVGLAATWGMAEHASTGIQPWLAVPVTMVHLLAVAVWLGGLATLALTMRVGPPVPTAVVRRFSRMAFGCVMVLVATGLYQAWRGVGSWGALTSTAYGQLLLVKLGFVTALVGTAWFSRRWTRRLTERTAAESGTAASAPPAADATEEREHATVAAQPESAEETGATGAAGAAGTTRATGDTAGDGAAHSPSTPDAPDTSHPADPAREAQLRRQRAAVAAARERKARDADPRRRALRQSVLTETAIAVVLLSVTTVLTGTQPGRAETEQAAAATEAQEQRSGPATVKVPYDTGGPDGAGTAEVTVDPGQAGANQMHVYLTNANGELVDAPEVRLSFTLEEKDIGPLDVTLTHVEGGHWAAADVQLPMAGDWQVSVTVRTSEIDQVTEKKKLTIP